MEDKIDIWVFDVCGTLYRSNTTFDFLEFFFEKSDSKRLEKLKGIRNKKRLIYWWRAIVFKLLDKDFFRKKAVQLLKGFDKKVVESEAQIFFDKILDEKRIEKSFILFFNAINDKKKVLLVSNSIEPVIRVIAKKLGVDFQATSLIEMDEKYTGEIKEEMTGRKHIKLLELGIRNYHVVTDNRSDYQLVKRANQKYVVIKKEEDRKFWNKLKPEYIRS